MSFGQTYGALREMIRSIVLETPVARDIVRRAGFRIGTQGSVESLGVPAGGDKGYALVKASDEDFDVQWQSHGPYTYDFNAYEDDTPPQWWHFMGRPPVDEPGAISRWYKDSSPRYAVEPVPAAAISWTHINRPLASGVDNGDSPVYEFDRWVARSVVVGAFDTLRWSWVDKRTAPTTSTTYKTNPTYSWDGDPLKMRASWPSGPAPLDEDETGPGTPTGGLTAPFGSFTGSLVALHASTAMRLQAYITDCSEDTWWEIGASRWFADADARAMVPGGPANLKRLYVGGPGYFDSGWMEFVDYDADEGENGSFASSLGSAASVDFHDFEMGNPSIPFVEVQVRGYEFSGSFDFLYPRGIEPQ